MLPRLASRSPGLTMASQARDAICSSSASTLACRRRAQAYLKAMHARFGRSRLRLGQVAGLTILALVTACPSDAGVSRRRRHAPAISTIAEPREPQPTVNQVDSPGALNTNLYKERGYGYGGTVFDLRTGGGPALGGTCTSVAATPVACRQGGVYGNGFIYGFGLP